MKKLFLNKDIKNYIMAFVYPTKKQMIMWKMDHYINGYYKVLTDIEDIIIEVEIDKNGEKQNYFSLFSLSMLSEYYYDYEY